MVPSFDSRRPGEAHLPLLELPRRCSKNDRISNDLSHLGGALVCRTAEWAPGDQCEPTSVRTCARPAPVAESCNSLLFTQSEPIVDKPERVVVRGVFAPLTRKATDGTNAPSMGLTTSVTSASFCATKEETDEDNARDHIDRTKTLAEEPGTGHNRWHPDIPPLVWCDPGDVVILPDP